MPERLLRDWTDSEAVDQLSWSAECLFVRLIMKADDFGRYHGNPKLLRSLLFPLKDGLRDADISRWIAECETAGLLRVYTDKVSGKPFIEIRKFGQRLRTKKAKFPDENGNLSASCSKMQQSAADCCNLPQNAAECGRMRLEEEVEVEEERERETARAREDVWQESEQIRSTFPRVGNIQDDCRAIVDAVQREADKPGGSVDSALELIRDSVRKYAESVSKWPPQKRKFIANCKSWFEAGRYNESPEMWDQNDQTTRPRRPDRATPPVFTEEDRDDDINECF
jgi:hypothetical protein|nr:MAG TPA: hypothetical protein [Caudoviricetes sp.]